MFVLSVLRDVVRVAPDKFDRDLVEVLSEELDKKYANKVIPNIGLCICTHDFKSIEEAKVYPSDGGAHHSVVFRLIVFRPFVGEVAVGTIVRSTSQGIHVSLDFFEDVFIPKHLLPQPSEYDARAKLWVWKYEGSGDGGVFHVDEQVRFQVERVDYTELSDTARGVVATTTTVEHRGASAGGGQGSIPPAQPFVRQRSTSVDLTDGEEQEEPPAMMIIGSVQDHGLGLVTWNWC
uniref:DNA-directed RNA polymerase III subunit RPC8 n=1 Tax=Rhizochromulina marina TaxID=1034831 RepID=A0A7S2SVH5_9STRA